MFPRQHVLFPDNVCCSRTTSAVPGRRAMFLDDVFPDDFLWKTCYVLFQCLSDVYRESSFNPWNRLPFPEFLFPIPRVLFHSMKSSSRFVNRRLLESPLLIPGIVFLSLKSSSLSQESSFTPRNHLPVLWVLFQSLESFPNLSSSLPFQLRRLPFSKVPLQFPSLSYI